MTRPVRDVDGLLTELLDAREKQLQARARRGDGDPCGVDQEKLATRRVDVLLERLFTTIPAQRRAEIAARPVHAVPVQGLR